MIKHYFKIAFRNLVRQKVLTFINIAGLTIGLACFILFLLFAVSEFSYDRFHANADNIYRVYSWWDYQGKESRKGSEPATSVPLGPAMKQDFPDVELFVRTTGGSHLVRTDKGEARVKLSFADQPFFSVFTFPLLYGNATAALNDPHNVVITKEKALQLFNEANPIGRTIEIKRGDKYERFVISAVAENIPSNSSIRFDLIGSFDYILSTEEGKKSMENKYMTFGAQVYVQLRKGSNLANDPARMAAFYQKYFPDEKEIVIKEGEWDGKSAFPSGLGLQPLQDMHTNVSIDQASVAPKNIWILIGIASAILLIACINFTTLAIGRSAGRAKEIGVRKVIGGMKSQLIKQFLAESFLLSFISALLGLLLAYILLPFFNKLSGKSLEFSFSQYPELILLLAGLIVLVGLLSGSYPALVLSRFRPVEVLKNKVRLAGSNLFTRSLVTFQFVLSIGLIIVTVVILQQLSYMRSKNLGFSKENVVMVTASGSDGSKVYPLFQQALQSNPAIIGITSSAIGLGASQGQMGRAYVFKDKKSAVIEYPIDHEYLKVMNMRLIAGRNFDPSIASDTINSVIVNEELVSWFMGVSPAEAVGNQIKEEKNGTMRTIIGVTGNFNFEDLTRKIRPQLFRQLTDFTPSVFFVRIGTGDPSAALASMESAWKSVVPELPFNYTFLDENFARFYKAEQRWSSIVGWAGAISIFLACLGLFGLAALATVNRTKEIGIRKVMGATVVNIVALLSKDFVKLVIIALVIASPIAWYFMNKWLQDYAYRINIGWWIFAITGVFALSIALLTIGFQAIRTAIVNPVKSLRTE